MLRFCQALLALDQEESVGTRCRRQGDDRGPTTARRILALVAFGLVAVGVSTAAASADLPDDPFSGTRAIDPSQLLGPTAPPLNAEQLERFAGEQANRQREDGTKDEFPGLNGTEAVRLLDDVFGKTISGLVFTPAEALEHADEVDRYPTDTSAQIDPAGPKKHALVDSTVPLVTGDGEPIDLSLRPVAGGLEPANSPSPLSVPGELDEPAIFGASGMKLSFPGADRAVDVRTLSVAGDADKEVAVYPEARTDVDLALAPATGGVEYMAQIRSTDAPEGLPIKIDGDGIELESQADGGVAIYRDSEQVGAVSPAISVDANGKPVPTSMSVSGDRVAIEVSHRGGDFSYPILMDPIVESWNWWTGGQPSYDFSAWTPAQSGSSSYQLTNSCTSGVTDSCQASGAGLYVNARPGYMFGAGTFGQWVYNVPWSQYGSSNNTFVAGATSNSWRYMHGTAPNTNPYAYIGTYGPGGWTQVKVYIGAGGGGSGNSFAGGPSTKQVVAGLGSVVNVTLPFGGWRYLRVASILVSLDDGNGTSSDPGNPAIWAFDQDKVPTGWLNAHDEVPLALTGADAGLGVKNIWALSLGREGGWWVGQSSSKSVENPNVTCTGLVGSRCPRVVTGTPVVKAGQLANGETPVTMLVTDALGKNTAGSNFSLKVDNRKPLVDLSGDAIDQENPGVRLAVHATDPSTAGEEDGVSGIEEIEVTVSGETGRA